jgi:DsbC/DsbD-like thiol-disulfide interchange protein/cytochrome c biogenesis protein CcdA
MPMKPALETMLRSLLPLLLPAMLVFGQPPAAAQPTATGDYVSVRWLAPRSLAAAEPALLALHFSVDPEWHVYWRNPGDSGAAPRFDFRAGGADLGPIQWPVPVRLPIAHLTNIGYEGDTAYFFTVTPHSGAEEIDLQLNLEWLVCKVECIPGFGQMSLNIPVAADERWDADDRALRDHFAARLPAAAPPANWRAEALERSGEALLLRLPPTASEPVVFPLDNEVVGAAAPILTQTTGSYTLRFPIEPSAATAISTGFLVSIGDAAWYLDDQLITVPAAGSKTLLGLVWLLVAAFAGGVILNLMPCVFPVLSIKVLALVRRPDGAFQSAVARWREGSLYSAGVVLTFLGLGVALLLLRASGAAVGWGFQLQSPGVVLALILLFWLVALSFSGVFEFGHRLMSMAGGRQGQSSFLTGVLAVFVAAPCTGPFMGAALGAAAVLPPLSALLIFLALGLGMALPLLLLTVTPALLSRLPSPGPWMDTLRQALAFPLYATVLWLLWVLARLLGDTAWIVGGSLLLGSVFLIWLAQHLNGRARFAVPVAAALGLVFAFKQLDAALTDSQGSRWAGYDVELIERARARGQPVFVDFTAAWCITCQVNKVRVLESAAVERAFSEHDVLLVRADWTRHDPAITAALAELGRNSVPVYAWYPPGESVQLLPQILQESTVVDLFSAPVPVTR